MMNTGTGQDIHVKESWSNEEGSCNACTRHLTSEGSARHRVYMIQLRYANVRVCRECLKELRRQLRVASGR